MNLKDLHIQYDGKNPCHREAVGNCTYRRTLGLIAAELKKPTKACPTAEYFSQSAITPQETSLLVGYSKNS